MSKKILLVISMLVVAMGAMGMSFAQDVGKSTISVTGTSSINLKATQATLQISITTDDAKSQMAVSKNAAKIKEVIASLTNLGIPKDNIKTSNYNIYVVRDYTNPARDGITYPIVGYTVTNSLKVKITDMGSIGKVIDAAANTDGIEIGHLTFSSANSSSNKKSAIAAAVRDAKSQAKAAAEELGVKLGKIKSVRVDVHSQNPAPIYYNSKVENGGVADTTVIADDVVMDATVLIVYFVE